jgi:plasmid rolling circle replication initiator protein Rep
MTGVFNRFSKYKPVSCTFLGLQKNPVILNKNKCGKKPEIHLLFFNFSKTFFVKCTCTRTHDNINLFLRETQNVEKRKRNYFHLL